MGITPVQNLIASVVAQSSPVASSGAPAAAGTSSPPVPSGSNAQDVALVHNVSAPLLRASSLYNAALDLAGLSSQITVAQSGTQQIANILQNLWDIAQQIAIGGEGAPLDSLVTQFQTLYSQINQVVAVSSFGGSSLLDGSFSLDNTALGQGAGGTQSQSTSIVPSLTTQGLFGAAAPDIFTPAGASAALGDIAGAQGIVNGAAGNLDNVSNQVNFAMASIQAAQANNDASTSVLNAGDIAGLGGFVSALLQKPAASASTQGTKLSGSVFGLIGGTPPGS